MKLKISILILATLIFMSCEDIVNSDKNILKTKLEYTEVLDNQTESVIMPLSANKKWYYNVTEFDENNNVIKNYIDSIVVLDVYSQNGYWFDMYMPYISDIPFLMTNTDVGLWVKREQNDEESFLLAKYPKYKNDFASDYINIEGKENIPDDEFESLEDIIIQKKSSEQSVSVPFGTFDCIKYNGSFYSEELDKNYMIEYFSPEVGLIKAELFDYQLQFISKSYELIDTTKSFLDEYCANTKYVALNESDMQAPHRENVNLLNEEDNSIEITDINIISETIPNIMTIVFPDAINLPISLNPNESIDLQLFFNSNNLTRYIGVIEVKTNRGCWYEITLEL